MVDICVMILTKFFSNFLFFSLVVLLNSCESFKSVMGLSKPVFEDSVANETPDLVLPPDFNVAPTNKTTNTYSSKLSTDAQNNYSEDNFNQGLNNSVIPEAKNFLAPTINFPSSSLPILTDATGPSQGISDIESAVDAPIVPSISGLILPS